MQLEYDVAKNPEIFSTLLSLEPEEVVSRGKLELEAQKKLIDDALLSAFKVVHA